MSVVAFPSDAVRPAQVKIDAIAALAFVDMLALDDIEFLQQTARDPRLSTGERLRLMGICMYLGRARCADRGWL